MSTPGGVVGVDPLIPTEPGVIATAYLSVVAVLMVAVCLLLMTTYSVKTLHVACSRVCIQRLYCCLKKVVV